MSTSDTENPPIVQCAKCRAVERPGGLAFRPCGRPRRSDQRWKCANKYCSPLCMQSHDTHRCAHEQWTAIVCLDQNFRKVRPFVPWCYLAQSDDYVGSEASVYDCMCTALMGTPLQLRAAKARVYARSSSFDNRLTLSNAPLCVPTTLIGDLLMMDPDNGWMSETAPWKDRGAMFLMIINRTDGKPLTPETLETVLEFLLTVQEDMSGTSAQDGWSPMREYLTPQAFQHFSRRYFREQREKGRDGFDGPFAPL